MNELVSIILPVYNAEEFLKTAIDSVLSQTYQYFELLIINDGSTDNTSNIIQTFNDPRIVFINQLSNKGITYRLNEGIKTATGKYIARIDADDIWHPQKLEKQVSYMKHHHDISFLATDFNFLNHNGQIIKTIKNSKYHLKKNILKRNLICHSSILLKKDIIKHIGKYNPAYEYAEDYDLWIRILSNYNSFILPEVLTNYRITNTSISFKHRHKQIINTTKIKINGFKILNFRYIYIVFLLIDIYRLLIPNFIIKFKRNLTNHA